MYIYFFKFININVYITKTLFFFIENTLCDENKYSQYVDLIS